MILIMALKASCYLSTLIVTELQGKSVPLSAVNGGCLLYQVEVMNTWLSITTVIKVKLTMFGGGG